MENEKTKQEEMAVNDEVPEDLQTSEYEYAFDEVPAEERKSLIELIFVLAGYPIALSNFVIGGAVGVGLTFSKAILALVIGNAVLITIVIGNGILAYKTGLSTSFLSRRALGKAGSSIFSVLLALCSITWVSLNGDIFSRLIDTTFSWWPLAIPITAVLVIFLWLQSAVHGFEGLRIISFVGVPAALLISFAGMVAVARTSGGFGEVMNYVPKNPITLTAATASIVGGWVFGAIISPDVCRFAKKKAHVYIGGLVAFVVGCFGLQFAGALVAITTGHGDFTEAMAALGLALLAFFAALFCLWTTQDNNIYAASLALQNIIKQTKFYGKVKHKHIAYLIGAIAAVFAAGGIYDHIMPVISSLSILVPPMFGLVMAEEYVVKNPNADEKVNWLAIIAWIIGGASGFIALRTNFFVPPVVAILVTGIAYILLNKINN